jgi:hypothetical protein
MSIWPILRHCLRGFAILLLAIAGGSGRSDAQVPSSGATPDSIGIARAAHFFLVAFDSLRWEPFATAWAADASVFLPDSEQPQLFVGRDAVLAYFRTMFADVRAAATTQVATLGILPRVQDLRIRLLGAETALVTFELGRGPTRGRRTVLWQWDSRARAWRIVHLHASRLSGG